MRSIALRERGTGGRSAVTSLRSGFGGSAPEAMKAARPPGLSTAKDCFRHIAADRIEHGVAAGHHAGEILRVVVDDLVGAEAAHIVDVRCAAGGDDAGADIFGELNGETGNAAGAALDQDRLAALQFQRVFDRIDRGQSGKRQRRGVDMRKPLRLLGDEGGRDCDLLAIGAFLAGAEHAEHRVAHLQIGAVADRADNAGKIAAGDLRKFDIGMSRIFAGAKLPVGGVDGRGMDVDHHLARAGHGIRQVAVLQHFRAAEFLDVSRFHWIRLSLSGFCNGRPSWHKDQRKFIAFVDSKSCGRSQPVP